MGAIFEVFSRFPDDTVDVIEGFVGSQDIVFCDKYDVGLGDVFKVLSGLCDVGIEEGAVVAGAMGICAFVFPLDFYIVIFPVFVFGQYVQSGGSAPQVFDVSLCADFLDFEVFSAEDESQEKLGALGF